MLSQNSEVRQHHPRFCITHAAAAFETALQSIKLIVKKCVSYCVFGAQGGSLAFKGTFRFGRIWHTTVEQFWKAAENSGYRLKIT